MNEAIHYLLWLSAVFGSANPRIHEILSRFGGPEEAYIALAGKDYDFLTDKERRSIRETSLDIALRLLDYCSLKCIDVTTMYSYDYPSQLTRIYNPPVILYHRGNLDFLSRQPSVALVGARNATVYAEKMTKLFASELSKIGVNIISGFAVGIDRAAHMATVEAGGRTAAVLGCGIDVDYPRESMSIKDMIIDAKGAIISEFPPGTPPLGPHFPVRNRIISGLSLGVAVMQAAERSGALNTVEMAISQGRDVFCLPPADVTAREYAGNCMLIRDGAIPICAFHDIVDEYYSGYSHKFNIFDPLDRYYAQDDDDADMQDKSRRRKSTAVSTFDEEQPQTEVKEEVASPDVSALDESSAKVVLMLAKGRAHIDEIADACEIGTDELNEILTELEIEGFISACAGNFFTLA